MFHTMSGKVSPYYPVHSGLIHVRIATAAFAALLLITATGCYPEHYSARSLSAGTLITSSEQASSTQTKVTVPLFEHGEGYGSFSEIAMVPPAFITEAEAEMLFDSISAEYGLEFNKDITAQVDNIKTALYIYDGFEPVETGGGVMQLSLDGYNDELGFAYEYISTDDIAAMQSYENEVLVFPTVTYGFRDAASLLLGEINRNESAPNTAVFYDPCLSYYDIAGDGGLFTMGRDEYYEEAKQQNMEQLEQQIRDFFEWLKAGDII